LSVLISIKQNYHRELNKDPIQRITRVPSILFNTNPLVVDYSKLIYLAPKSSDDNRQKWGSLPVIRNLIANYNYLLSLWLHRNEIDVPNREKIMRKNKDKAFLDVRFEDIKACIGEADLVKWIDSTEQVIILTDDLIVELHDFLNNFPIFAKTRIDFNKLGDYGAILTFYDKGNKSILDMLVKSPVADYSKVNDLFGKTVEQMRQRYSTGYEKM